jgi:hypothetical protein
MNIGIPSDKLNKPIFLENFGLFTREIKSAKIVILKRLMMMNPVKSRISSRLI